MSRRLCARRQTTGGAALECEPPGRRPPAAGRHQFYRISRPPDAPLTL
ncbi:MAG: hypothetical protein MZU79_00665 [Anaerotruncus sp.]|nr:hypothetical protein [Anaerotruncus sp.]